MGACGRMWISRLCLLLFTSTRAGNTLIGVRWERWTQVFGLTFTPFILRLEHVSAGSISPALPSSVEVVGISCRVSQVLHVSLVHICLRSLTHIKAEHSPSSHESRDEQLTAPVTHCHGECSPWVPVYQCFGSFSAFQKDHGASILPDPSRKIPSSVWILRSYRGKRLYILICVSPGDPCSDMKTSMELIALRLRSFCGRGMSVSGLHQAASGSWWIACSAQQVACVPCTLWYLQFMYWSCQVWKTSSISIDGRLTGYGFCPRLAVGSWRASNVGAHWERDCAFVARAGARKLWAGHASGL